MMSRSAPVAAAALSAMAHNLARAVGSAAASATGGAIAATPALHHTTAAVARCRGAHQQAARALATMPGTGLGPGCYAANCSSNRWPLAHNNTTAAQPHTRTVSYSSRSQSSASAGGAAPEAADDNDDVGSDTDAKAESYVPPAPLVQAAMRGLSGKVPAFSQSTPVMTAFRELSAQSADCAIVLQDGSDNVVGTFCDSDYVYNLSNLEDTPLSQVQVGECMTTPVVMADASASVNRTLAAMADQRCRYLPVISDDAAAALVSGEASQPVAQHCVEIISNRDLLRVFLRWLDEGGAPDPDSDDEGEGYDVHTNAGDVLEHMHRAHQRKLLLNTRASDGITVHEAVKAMSSTGAGSVVVVNDEGDTLGLMTARDYVRLLRSDVDTSTTLVTDIMTTNPVQSNTTVSAGKCARLMIDNGIRHLPICEPTSKTPRGVTSMLDLVHIICALPDDAGSDSESSISGASFEVLLGSKWAVDDDEGEESS